MSGIRLIPLMIVLCSTVQLYGVSSKIDPLFQSGICNAGTINPCRRILDITHAYREDMPVHDSSEGLGSWLRLAHSMKNGSSYNGSEMKLGVHTGTHVDSPAHFYQEYYEAGFDVDTLDLETLNGPTLLVDVPRDTNITVLGTPAFLVPSTFTSAKLSMVATYFEEGEDSSTSAIPATVMKALNIPKGVQRVLFRTLNTDRRLMWKREFDSSFVGFMEDGAQWLVDNTNIKLVGIDYLSVAAYDHLALTHFVLLANKDIILVEGLNLDDIEVGIYSMHCLPLRLVGSEGSPTRCILIK